MTLVYIILLYAFLYGYLYPLVLISPFFIILSYWSNTQFGRRYCLIETFKWFCISLIPVVPGLTIIYVLEYTFKSYIEETYNKIKVNIKTFNMKEVIDQWVKNDPTSPRNIELDRREKKRKKPNPILNRFEILDIRKKKRKWSLWKN